MLVALDVFRSTLAFMQRGLGCSFMCSMDNAIQNYKILSWNVRGLNNPAKREDVRQVISSLKPDHICLQETKLSSFNPAIIRNTLGQDFVNNFVYLPAIESRGGILIAARDDVCWLQHLSQTDHTITAAVTNQGSNTTWKISGVYGPQSEWDKKMFIRELRGIKQLVQSRWLLIRDFNLIYQDQDKNNNHLNRRMMNRFRRALNFLEVKEIELLGRQFTWSSNQQTPTLTRIDKALCTLAW
jgi:exonuclease III